MTADDRERLLTTGEAAAVLGGTDTTVKRWVRTGMLASVATRVGIAVTVPPTWSD